MLIGSTIFLLAFFTAVYMITTLPTGAGTEEVRLESTALRVSDLLVEGSGWMGSSNFTRSFGPNESAFQMDTTGNSSAGNVRWETSWNRSGGQTVERLGLALKTDGVGPTPVNATAGNETYGGTLSVYKLDGEVNSSFGTEGLMVRGPSGAKGEGHGDVNQSWWWEFGRSVAEDSEYDLAREALGLDFRGLNFYVQVRPVNTSAYDASQADEALDRGVPDRESVVKVERNVMVSYYDREEKRWALVRESDTRASRFRFLLYVWG